MFAHMPCRRTQREERTVQIYVHYPPPFSRSHLNGGLGLPSDTGIGKTTHRLGQGHPGF